MRDQKLDRYHDLAIENNDFAAVEGLPEMVQAVRIAILTIKYEWWLDGTIGVPWNHGMFQPFVTQAEKELHVKKSVLSVEGVTSVDQLTYSHDQELRSDLISLSAETIEGTIGNVGV